MSSGFITGTRLGILGPPRRRRVAEADFWAVAEAVRAAPWRALDVADDDERLTVLKILECSIEVEHVTPDRARELLAYNSAHHTSALSQDKVTRYARAMKASRWRPGTDVIEVATLPGGVQVLCNGQHRLAAVIKSGCTVDLIVITGEDPERHLAPAQRRAIRNSEETQARIAAAREAKA
jgi:hypothetical protein